jgi:hypothetical protein
MAVAVPSREEGAVVPSPVTGPALFRSGWFVESLATQTLVIFAIRTRRIPFFRSRPSLPLTLAAPPASPPAFSGQPAGPARRREWCECFRCLMVSPRGGSRSPTSR